MTLAELDEALSVFEAHLSKTDRELLKGQIEAIRAVFPFNDWEYRIAFLLEHGCLSFPEYEELRSRYIAGNEYRYLFGLAPRVFGQIWGEEHIREIDERFIKASKKLDSTFSGEYDLFLNGIKVEVKAARAISAKLKSGDLVARAMKYDSRDPFWMNFQQLKPTMCDVFIFIGVWVDRIVYWVLSSQEVQVSPFISSQHRGGIEYQIDVRESNLTSFAQFSVDRQNLAATVIRKARR